MKDLDYFSSDSRYLPSFQRRNSRHVSEGRKSKVRSHYVLSKRPVLQVDVIVELLETENDLFPGKPEVISRER
jgi:hypothetical protein